jgi:hypothetical protein
MNPARLLVQFSSALAEFITRLNSSVLFRRGGTVVRKLPALFGMGVVIVASNVVVLALSLFALFVSEPNAWFYLAFPTAVAFVSGLVIGEIQVAFGAALACFGASLGSGAFLVGMFTYLYPNADGALRQFMASIFLQRVLLSAMFLLLPLYMLSWVLGSLFSEYIIRP